jgi:hypothetical protein
VLFLANSNPHAKKPRIILGVFLFPPDGLTTGADKLTLVAGDRVCSTLLQTVTHMPIEYSGFVLPCCR